MGSSVTGAATGEIMASKRLFEYRTKLLILEGSADDTYVYESNEKVQDALNDPSMHEGGFELDQIVGLSRGSKFTNHIIVLVVLSRAVRK